MFLDLCYTCGLRALIEVFVVVCNAKVLVQQIPLFELGKEIILYAL
jgi:hypothetical protein